MCNIYAAQYSYQYNFADDPEVEGGLQGLLVCSSQAAAPFGIDGHDIPASRFSVGSKGVLGHEQISTCSYEYC